MHQHPFGRACGRGCRGADALFITFGMGIVLALWPYIIAVLIILLRVWILVNGFVKPYYISLGK